MKNYKSFRIDDILVDSGAKKSSIKVEGEGEKKADLKFLNISHADSDLSRLSWPFQLSPVTEKVEPSYSTLFPYYSSLDSALRLSYSRNLYKNYSSDSQLLHFAPFLGTMGTSSSGDYREAYSSGVTAQYGDGVHGRGHYAMYGLTRGLYSSSCKRKGGQIRFNNSQTGHLEKAFVQQKYLNATDRKKLAQSLGLTDRQVKTWFQNRRAKLRKSKRSECLELEMPESPQTHQNGSPPYLTSPTIRTN